MGWFLPALFAAQAAYGIGKSIWGGKDDEPGEMTDEEKKAYIASRVRGVSTAISPYMRQMKEQEAMSLAGRGGLAGGGQDIALSNLNRMKVGALSGAASEAQGQLSDVELQRFYMTMMKKKQKGDWLRDLLKSSGMMMGYTWPQGGGGGGATPGGGTGQYWQMPDWRG